MAYSIEKFKTSDWDEIEVRDEALADFNIIKKEMIYKEIYNNGAPTFTLRYNEKVLAIYGFSYGGMGTYFPYVCADKELYKHTKKMVKLFYEYFAKYIPTACKRMEAYVDITDKKAMRLAQHFGFSIIGIRHYATAEGHDQAIFERIVCCDHRKMKK